MKKSFNNILNRIKNKKALIYTKDELLKIIKKNKKIDLNKIDIITAGTRGLMSGTYAILSISLNDFPQFKRAKYVYLNGIECFVGPCPNENLNLIDIFIFGTKRSIYNEKYGAGHLFRDLVENKNIKLYLITNDQKKYNKLITLNNITFAKLMSTRNSFKNYKAFINDSNNNIKTIFHPSSFKPFIKEATVSGCGSINPIQNDPYLKSIGIGTKVLVNGSEGFVIGLGTRSTKDNPNLMIISDMKKMNPLYMGGFNTSMGPECIVSISIPVININNYFEDKVIFQQNSDVPLVISNVYKREDISKTLYSDVWEDTDDKINVNLSNCTNCKICLPFLFCPCNAILKKDNYIIFNEEICFNCGYCTTTCKNSVFSANLGSLKFIYNNINYNIPIVCRQSDIFRAKLIELELKNKIINNHFLPTMYSEKLF